MRPKQHRFAPHPVALALLASAALWGSCAQERPVRSFVQPNLMKKADLDGEWYYTQTVVDAPPSNATLFVGLSSELIKGKFDIQQEYIYYRRSYEQIGGSEDVRARDPRGYYGQPLAAWRVNRHFDLIRDYSAVTGEQTNRIIESEERQWQQREYVRVDWSQNLVTDYIGIGLNMFFSKDDGVTIQPVSYWEADPTQQDGIYKEFQDPPVLEAGQTEEQALKEMEFKPGEMVYFDVTNKFVLTPHEITLTFEEGGKTESVTYPRCFLAYEIDDCASQVVKVRHAFAKISPKHDYVPRDWDGLQMQRFGIWDVNLNRLNYDRRYGLTNTGLKRKAARFNIWKKSTRVNDEGQVEPIPYAERQLKTIPYYAESSYRERRVGKVGEYDVDLYGGNTKDAEGNTEDLFDMGKEVVRQWNDVFKDAYRAATMDRDPSRVLAADNMGKEADRDIFVFCHVPVDLAKDPKECWKNLNSLKTYDKEGRLVDVLDEKGNKVYRPRQGDPRRSTIFWVHQMQASGPLGYGPGLYDPVTGETISGQSYIYGAAIDTYSARSRDLMLLMTGQISTDNFIKGVDVSRQVSEAREGKASQAQMFTKEELLKISMGMNFDWALGLAPEAPLDVSSVAALRESMKRRAEAIYKTGVYGHGEADPSVVRKARLRNQPLESMMVQADMLQGLTTKRGPVTWESLTAAEKARLSPLRAAAAREAIERRKEMMSAFGADFADFFDEGIFQRVLLTWQEAQKNPELGLTTGQNNCDDGTGARRGACFNADKLRTHLKKQIFLGVTLHEMGHNLGLRHNFRASYDAMNFFPEYWKLRQDGLKATKDCLGRNFTVASTGQLGPRYINRPGGATSDIECKGGVREYQYSSIMDYGSEFNMDLHGLGLYDRAAIKFSYAEVLEVFTDAKQDKLEDWAALQDASSSYGLPSPLRPVVGLDAIPYYRYPTFFDNGSTGIYRRANIPMELARNVSTQEGNVVYGVKKGSRTYPVVPYYFCSDEYAGNLTCQRFDSGADPYEQVADVIARYNSYYLINNFKRDKYQFWASAAYQSRISGRYFNLLRQQMTWYTLLRSEFIDYMYRIAQLGFVDPNDARRASNEFFAREDQWGSFTAAVSMGFDTLWGVVTRPNFGSFAQLKAEESPDYPVTHYKMWSDRIFADPRFKPIPVGVGRHATTTWDFEGCGYYWFDQCTTRIGYFHDKRIALDILTQSQAYFTGRDTATDVRKYAIGYFRLFPQHMMDRFGALLSGDVGAIAPYFDGTGKVVSRSAVTGEFPGSAPLSENMIDPEIGFTLQVEAGVNLLSNVASGFDQEVIEETAIFIAGNGEAPVQDLAIWDPVAGRPGSLATDNPAELKSACDPKAANFQACLIGKKSWFVYKAMNDRVYAAHSVPRRLSTTLVGVPAAVLRMDIGVRMLEMLRTLELAYQAAVALPMNNPDRERRIAVAETRLKKYMSNVQVMRSLHKAFGYGPYKTDAPFVY